MITYQCFVERCPKQVHTLLDLVAHARHFHPEDARLHAVVLTKIEERELMKDPVLRSAREYLESL